MTSRAHALVSRWVYGIASSSGVTMAADSGVIMGASGRGVVVFVGHLLDLRLDFVDHARHVEGSANVLDLEGYFKGVCDEVR